MAWVVGLTAVTDPTDINTDFAEHDDCEFHSVNMRNGCLTCTSSFSSRLLGRNHVKCSLGRLFFLPQRLRDCYHHHHHIDNYDDNYDKYHNFNVTDCQRNAL